MAEPICLGETIFDDAEFREWNERFEARQKKIRLAPNVQSELEKLAQDGADAAKVLKLLALIVPNDDESQIEFFKSRQQHLTALANRIARLSKEIEATLSAPLNSSAFVGFGFLPELVKEFPTQEALKRLSSASIRRIKPILDLLRAEAREFGRMSRIYSGLKRDDVLGRLLRYVKESTGQFHDERMANLLQSAHEALAVDIAFSGPQLRKLRLRNFPALAGKRKKSNLSGESLGFP